MDSDILNSITPPSIESPVTRANNNRSERQRTLSIGLSLNSNANFYDIPASDAFNDLLERYVPPEDRPQRDINSDQSKSPEVMMMNNMWRSVAKYARQQIIQSDDSQVKHVLQLWHMRLLALTKLGLYQLATAEFEKLGDLDRLELKDPVTKESLVPYSLWILWARLPSYLKYPRLTLERLAMLAARCKKYKTDPIWAHREIQTYLVLVTHWIAIEDYSAAASTMELILSKAPDQVDILSGLGRLYLQMGDIDSANRMFERMRKFINEEDETVKINKAFTLMSKGEWHQARDLLQQVYESNNENLLVMNNLAVCEIYLGNSIKAIEILETLTIKNPTSAGTCEVALMNLCVLYGLRYEDSTEKKVEVMKQVARWAGDSFQPECFKLQ